MYLSNTNLNRDSNNDSNTDSIWIPIMILIHISNRRLKYMFYNDRINLSLTFVLQHL